MKFPEESYARDLHHDLTKVIGSVVPGTTVGLAGAGVHWHCTIAHGARQCLVHCFDSKGPEYLTAFEHETEQRAMGRTSSKADTIAAVSNWIAGHEVAELHECFVFVDQQKRSLESIVARAIRDFPELSQTERELQNLACDLYELWIRHGDRSCRIYYYGKNAHPEAIFNWDEARLFAFQATDLGQLGLILKLWICDHVAPSQLQKDFPWIQMGKAARYHEEGRGIEGEFIESWDRIEKFYEEMNSPPAEAIRTFIGALRKKGYDHSLRAGQSMYTLMLSRSRRHGLRQDQPHLAIQFSERGMEVCPKNLGGANLTLPEVVLTDDLEATLRKLANVTID